MGTGNRTLGNNGCDSDGLPNYYNNLYCNRNNLGLL
jgi:hypothetical protein